MPDDIGILNQEELHQPVNLDESLHGGVPNSGLRVASGGQDVRDEFAHGQLTRPVSVESVLEQEEHLDPHPAVLVAEGGGDLLEQLLRLHRGVHQLAEDDVGFVPDLLPGVPESVEDAVQDCVEVRLELGRQPVNEESHNIQTILRHLQTLFIISKSLLLKESFLKRTLKLLDCIHGTRPSMNPPMSSQSRGLASSLR